MAEAIEINFPTESDKNPKIDSELKNQILGFDVKESMEKGKNKEGCPEEYTIDNYYKEIQGAGGGKWDTSSLYKRLKDIV